MRVAALGSEERRSVGEGRWNLGWARGVRADSEEQIRRQTRVDASEASYGRIGRESEQLGWGWEIYGC